MAVIIFLLIIIIGLLVYPPLVIGLFALITIWYTFVAFLPVLPTIFKIFGLVFIIALAYEACLLIHDYFFLEGRIIDSVVSRQGSATVSEILSDLGGGLHFRMGVNVDKDDCFTSECRVYSVIGLLMEDGKLFLSGSEEELNSFNQILKLNQKEVIPTQ